LRLRPRSAPRRRWIRYWSGPFRSRSM
jgi:hypothetical protein